MKYVIVEKIDNDQLTPDMYPAGFNFLPSHEVKIGNCKNSVVVTRDKKHYLPVNIDKVWYWVDACDKCHDLSDDSTGTSHMRCEKHNTCSDCNTKRSDINDTVWGDGSGFLCRPCAEAREQKKFAKALKVINSYEYDPLEFKMQDEPLCPYCKTELDADENTVQENEKNRCDECGYTYTITPECHITWTTQRTTEPKALNTESQDAK
ncbi:hypothetical protein VCHA53O466_50351 [Vibrio chagasii]|nr:hypothetical protein VCHA53O466_50351 [Vibrio chagasii]